MKRPALSAASFLKHLFAPKTNPLPTGIRKRALKGAKGQSKARIAAYNRMSGASQEILRMSGMRDQYLKGEASLADAKKGLRQQAVSKGYAKPTKNDIQKARLDKHVSSAAHVVAKTVAKLRDGGKEVNPANMLRRMAALDDASLGYISNLPYEEIRRYAADKDQMITLPDGTQFNPLWYH